MAGLAMILLGASALAQDAWLSGRSLFTTHCSTCHTSILKAGRSVAHINEAISVQQCMNTTTSVCATVSGGTTTSSDLRGLSLSTTTIADIAFYLSTPRHATFSPANHDFTGTAVDAAVNPSQVFTLTNDGDASRGATTSTLVIDGVISPSDTNFVLNPTTTCTGSLTVNGTCTVVLTFNPLSTQAASFTTSFGIRHNGFNATTTATARGRGLKNLEITTASLLPFSASLTNTSGTQNVAIANRLSAELRLCLVDETSFSAPGDFNLVGRAYDAAPGRCATVPHPVGNQDITFTPSAEGTRRARFTVQRVDGGVPVDPEESIGLEGNVGPFLSISGLGLTGNVLFAGVGQDINGVAAVSSIDLRNAGNAALRVSSISVAGAASAEYSATGCAAGTTLAPGDPPCKLSVTFDPTDSDVRTAQLQVTYADLVNSDASRKTVAVDLRGSGTRGASLVVRNAMGSEIATGSTESFGNQNINIAYRRQITLSNIGSVEGLQVLAPSVVPGAAGFDLVASTASPSISCTSLTAGFSLAPGGSCAADILFQPSEVRGYASNLTLATRPVGAATEPVNFVLALSADGVDGRPALAWQMPVGYSVALIEVPGITAVGSPTPPEVRLHLVNSGPGAAALQLLNIVGPDAASFSIDNAAPGRCEFGAADSVLDDARPSCEVVITFRPQTAGAKSARLQLVSTGTTPVPIEIRAQGSGPALAIGLTATPASMSLADTRIGAQSAPATVVLSNSGMVSALVTALDTSPGFAVDTGSCGAPPFSMAPNSSCTLSVRFVPSSTGVSNGRLSVQVSGLAAPVEVALEGTGTEAADVSGGGCSITSGKKTIDPTLWALMMAAGVAMVYRRKGQSRTRLKRQTGPAAHSDHRKWSST